MPHGADAVVQIEDSEVVGRTALGAPVVDIKKVGRSLRDEQLGSVGQVLLQGAPDDVAGM